MSTTLGRLIVPDIRDQDYPMRAALKSAPSTTEDFEAITRGYRYWWQDGAWGDQWYTPQCVAYAWMHLIEDGPVTHEPRAPQRKAVHRPEAALVDTDRLYRQCQEIDEWPGTDYDGTSVRAGAKMLHSMGLISGYSWANDVETVATAVLTTGPVVVGTSWYAGMTDPVSVEMPDNSYRDVLRAEGEYQGGHAWLINGVTGEWGGWFRMKNSWGRGWARQGTAWIDFATMQRLLDDYGEACMPLEVHTR